MHWLHRLHRRKVALTNTTSAIIGIYPTITMERRPLPLIVRVVVTLGVGGAAKPRLLLPLHLPLPLSLDVLLGFRGYFVKDVGEIVGA